MCKKTIIGLLGVVLTLAIIPSMSFAQVVNLANLNNSFEEEVNFFNGGWGGGWVTWNPTEGNGSEISYDSDEFIDGVKSLRVEAQGTAAWHFQVIYAAIPLTVGDEYTASVWAKAEEPRTFVMQFKAMDNSATWGQSGPLDLTTEWTEYAITAEAQNNNIKLEIQCGGSEIPMWLDFFNVYEGPYVEGINPSGLSVPVKARNPKPAMDATDVIRDVELSWTAGEFAQTHDVYFGMVWDDVNAASIDAPLGVLVSPGQTATTYDPGRLAFSQTYYWRVDEVNGAPDNDVHKGDIWTFTVEPQSYPISNVTATASSTHSPDMTAQKTVDGSGLDALDQHNTDGATMWLSAATDLERWIQYEFDRAYKLHEMWVWNSNQVVESFIGFGAKDVTIEISLDGSNWTTLENVPEFARATGAADYTANTTVDFGGQMAQFVKLTVNAPWGGLPQTGLSEVRFFYIPAYPRNFSPMDGTVLDSLETTLSWRSARQSDVAKVLLSADQAAVEDGSAVVDTIGDTSYPVSDLDYASVYFWQIIDSNVVAVPSEATGPILTFLTPTDGMIDDMELYKDEEFLEIWSFWADGYNDATNGAIVGNGSAPETNVVYEGRQSLPMAYDNTTAPKSETTRTFDPPLDLTTGNPESLQLQVRGDAPAFIDGGDTLMVGGSGADIWGVTDEFRFVYKTLNGDGSMTALVESLTHVDAWAKAGVMIRETLTAESSAAWTTATGTNGVAFQYRETSFLEAAWEDARPPEQANQDDEPVWVRIERTGNVITGYWSLDGVNWSEAASPQTIEMISEVKIGLCVTSHDNDQSSTAVFSNISTTGGVSGGWAVETFGEGHPENDPAVMYVRLTDTNGNIKTFEHPNPQATVMTSWETWTIPFSELGSVNPARIKSISVGVGGQNVTGKVYVDAIRVHKDRKP